MWILYIALFILLVWLAVIFPWLWIIYGIIIILGLIQLFSD